MDNNYKETAKVNGLAIAGLILTIAAFPLLCVDFIGIFVGALGFILCLVSRRKETEKAFSSVAVAGIAIGAFVVSLGLCILVISYISLRMQYS